MIWDVGETVMENSELPLLPGPPPTTVRRGDIVQPAAASIRTIASHLKWVRTACSSLYCASPGAHPRSGFGYSIGLRFSSPCLPNWKRKRQLLRYARRDE